jgi:pseudo-rSAM protein
MKKHWFTLHSDTFLWLKGSTGFFYNAENGEKNISPLTDKIENICHQLLKTANLYTTELTDEALNDDEVKRWIDSLINIQAGYLSLDVAFEERPVSLKPILKVQDNKKYYEEQHKLGFKGKILQNLHELTFYINGSDYGNNEYFKQAIFPLKVNQTLDSSKILSFIKNSKSVFLSNINIVGNLFSYPGYERLIQDISEFSLQSTIHITINDFLNHRQNIKSIKWPTTVQFNILIDTVFDIPCLQGLSSPFSITAFVFSENDFIQFSSIFEASPKELNIRFIPLYNKENLSFFESNIFIEKGELDKIELSKDEIFMKQAFNIGNFGKLTVMPDGKIYANVNMFPLGTIDESPYSIVYKEFTAGKSWFKLRDQIPCNSCIYQWLCPSPSNYELVIGKSNLCHVKP